MELLLMLFTNISRYCTTSGSFIRLFSQFIFLSPFYRVYKITNETQLLKDKSIKQSFLHSELT